MDALSALPFHRRSLLALAIAASITAACGGSDDDDSDDESDRADDAMLMPDDQMQAVLDALVALGAQPIDTLTVDEARTQPTPADAVRAVLTAQGASTDPEPVGSVEDRVIDLPDGSQTTVRIYTPATPVAAPLPSLLYIHGGGWVIATLDTYDASARALCNAAGAIVVSVEYRKAPEVPFPGAHEDTWGAWQWLLDNAEGLGGDAVRIAVVGESAGGNMAASIARRARDEDVQEPVHQVLVYPVVDADVTSPSERQNANAAPLNTASLTWFYERYLPNPSDRTDPRFALREADLAGLASATVITADIDPLRSEGRAYAEALDDAGVNVRWINYRGVTHEFFGMTAVVDKAREAVAAAAADLTAAFARV
jgi:acetyl esterase